MISQKTLKLYKYVDGVNDIPFYGDEGYVDFILSNGDTLVTSSGETFSVRSLNEQIEIGEFKYTAQRMGAAPSLSFTLMFPACLDGLWDDSIYALFNGEKYFLTKTPTSSKSYDDARYKHDVNLVSERTILDNTYFYDAVADGNMVEQDRPVSNGTQFSFFGDIENFAQRLNMSLRYLGLQTIDSNGVVSGYRVIVDRGVTTEEKFVTFEDVMFSSAIQESYNTYEVPYYFVGKEIHFGDAKSVIDTPFEYGIENALLSVMKENANNKVVNRATGTGSEDNIPFYYPNPSPKGFISAVVAPKQHDYSVRIVDNELFSNGLKIGESIQYSKKTSAITSAWRNKVTTTHSGERILYNKIYYRGMSESYTFKVNSTKSAESKFLLQMEYDFVRDDNNNIIIPAVTLVLKVNGKGVTDKVKIINNVPNYFYVPLEVGENVITAEYVFDFPYVSSTDRYNGDIALTYGITDTNAWFKGDRVIELSKIGLKEEGTPADGTTITQKLDKYIKTSTKLMPSIYRETDGAERFYNAVNGKYEGFEFPNPYREGMPREDIAEFEDIKPTIKGMLNADGLRMDMFSEFAYDEGDSDQTYEDKDGNTNYVHPYFFAKLRKLDFNLFDHAIDGNEMTFSMTSGACGACNFKIGVSEEEPQKNTVIVDENGDLVRDENGRVLCGIEDFQKEGVEIQERQNDTINNEVWIALMKEEETYGIFMPKAEVRNEDGTLKESAYRPKACSEGKNDGDTFVILGINLPMTYITQAEKRLEKAILQHILDNNTEKFNFSITFSRIFLEENPSILESLDENSKITVRYNGEEFPLFVSDFNYTMSSSDILPEIKVTLVDSLSTSKNVIQSAISQVKMQMLKEINNIDLVSKLSTAFVQKSTSDTISGVVDFKKGIKFGEGGEIEILDNNSAKLRIDYLEVTKKATFDSLEIQEKSHIGGQLLVTASSLTCGEVEELDNAYRCYFQTKGEDGEELQNSWAKGDQAICQTFNAYGSRYLWRLVVGVGGDYIDLSKDDCDEGSDAPIKGDKIIQFGNRSDKERQNAIVISACGDETPSIIQYSGINSYDLSSANIVTKFSPKENIITGKLKIEAGSSGYENIDGLSDFINNSIGGLSVGKYNLLRNSGFTGDFVTEALVNVTTLIENKEMFSDQLTHWEHSDVVIEDSSEAVSGKRAVIGGYLRQTIEEPIIVGEHYVLSFYVSGVNGVNYSIGGVSGTADKGDLEYRKVVEKFVATSNNNTLSFEPVADTTTIWDVQLERGTVASSWGTSMKDNQSNLAYYKLLQYLSSAIKDGNTYVIGGLILSNMLLLGNPKTNGNTAGISGIYEDENDVAFWGGGTYIQALETVMKYVDNPSYIPTEEELASMAKIVITHGGRAILNDAIFRGIVYASGGNFNGEVNSKSGNIGGFTIGDNWLEAVQEDSSGVLSTHQLSSSASYLRALKPILGVTTSAVRRLYATAGGEGTFAADTIVVEGETQDGYDSLYAYYADVTKAKDNYAFFAEHGAFGGLKPKTIVLRSSSGYDLSKAQYAYNIYIDTSSNYTLTLPSEPEEGETHRVIKHWTSGQLIVKVGDKSTQSINKFGLNASDTAVFAEGQVMAEYIYIGGGVWSQIIYYSNSKK